MKTVIRNDEKNVAPLSYLNKRSASTRTTRRARALLAELCSSFLSPAQSLDFQRTRKFWRTHGARASCGEKVSQTRLQLINSPNNPRRGERDKRKRQSQPILAKQKCLLHGERERINRSKISHLNGETLFLSSPPYICIYVLLSTWSSRPEAI